MRLYVAVIGDGYLYGASRSPLAHDSHYWLQLRLEDEPFTVYAVDVPEDVATKLEAQGTSEQIFSDGYEARYETVKAGAALPWEIVDTFNDHEEN